MTELRRIYLEVVGIRKKEHKKYDWSLTLYLRALIEAKKIPEIVKNIRSKDCEEGIEVCVEPSEIEEDVLKKKIGGFLRQFGIRVKMSA